MAQSPVVEIVLKVVDKFSAELKQAEEKVSGWGTKTTAMLKAVAGLATAAALGKFFKSAIEEASAAERSMARLGVAVANAGDDMATFGPAAERALKSIQRLTVYSDDDAREALTRLITVTGDSNASLQNLSLVTDLAAARSIGLSEAADIVGKAMMGNTTQLNRMGFAGATAAEALATLRSSVSGFAETEGATFQGVLQRLVNHWNDFKEAVGTAILGTGRMGQAASGLVGILAGMAEWVERNSHVIGRIVDVLVRAGEVVGRVLVTAFKLLLPALRPVVWLVGTLLEGLGWLVEKGTALLRKVGVDIDAGLGTSLRDAGKAMKGLVQGASSAEKEMTTATATGTATRTRLTQDEVKARKAATRDLAREIERMEEEIAVKAIQLQEQVTEQQAKEILRRQQLLGTATTTIVRSAADGLRQLDQLNVQIAAGFDRELKPAIKRSTLEVELFDATIRQAPESTKVAIRQQKLSWDDLLPVLREAKTALDTVGQATGGVAAELSQAVDQAVVLGTALAKAATGDPTAIVGAVSTVVTVFAGLFGSAAQERARRIMQENTDAIRAHTRRIGDLLTQSQPLAQVGAIEAAIREAVAIGEKLPTGGRLGGLGPKITTDALRQALISRGLTFTDFAQLAEALGIKTPAAGEDWTPQGLRQLLDAIQSVEWTRFGQDFAGQMAFLRSALSTGALPREAEFGELVGLASRLGADALVRAIGDVGSPTGRADTLAALRQLVLELNRGTLDRSAFGELTGREFVELLESLINILADPERVIGGFELPRARELEQPIALALGDAFTVAAPTFAEPLLGPLAEQTHWLERIAGTLDALQLSLLTASDPATSGMVGVDDLDQALGRRVAWRTTARGVPATG